MKASARRISGVVFCIAHNHHVIGCASILLSGFRRLR
jgi:hypothetical protein